jgi:hypothetical protein
MSAERSALKICLWIYNCPKYVRFITTTLKKMENNTEEIPRFNKD